MEAGPVSARLVHFDRVSIRFDRSSMQPQADGSRLVDGYGAHVGPYTYHDSAGRPFIEHVPAATLFEPASLESAAGSALTIYHGPGLVTPDRYREEAHGSWVRAWQADGGRLGVRLRLGSQEAIDFVDQAIAKGDAVELSPVYEVDVVEGQDDAEAAKYGRHDAVQRERRYSGIALLGPNEARGGSEMALKLDAKTRAPDGCRMQISASRLDSGPPAPLHSETGRSNTMKQAKITALGKTRSVTDAKARALASLHMDAKRGDQVETARMLIEIEGEEPVDLVMPKTLVEGMMESAGITMAAAPAEAPAEEEMIAAEGFDADDDEQFDSKLDAKVERAVAKRFDAWERKRKTDSVRETSVHADARTILGSSYVYDKPWTVVAVDAIAKADPSKVERARKLAADAKTNPVHEGMLRQMLADLRRSSSDSTPTTIVKTAADGSDEPSWKADSMPEIGS
jgi:ElaB/YqjD/DUF883 family membrane-anchored ribosome-binding protein